ncbi:restriction endonuclease subunit S [Fusobacterium mortiferum]|uniref:restriction endonuclease subunit S n=1 Tax=Fusobacterium mortiferum TaxID=850 RepID=UPI0022E6CEA9|nr:restriction endonuclease subunit S [Fusobacterium mortiferum]
MIKFVLENFDTIFRNEKSLKSLNKIILDLAIRGKLVEQNPEDEPASELLTRIKEEKERLIKEKVIKKEKELPKMEEDEIPFEIPESWEWVRLGEICEINMGQSPKGESVNFSDGVGLIGGASDMGEIFPKIKRYTTSPTKLCKKDDLILSVRATLGRPIFSDGIYCLGRGACGISSSVINKKFLRNYFFSMEKELYSKANGTTFLQVTREDIVTLFFPLPPLAEQKRIVEKVERLQELIKNLKEVYLSNEKSRLNLKKSLLVEIEKSNSDKELLKNLELVFSNFDKVIRSKEDIKDIRNLILSLAIKGKLVEQNSEDEPASELLKRIKEEKERLVKEKELPKIEKDEIPFEIPESWEWVRLGEIGILQTGNTPSTSKNEYYGNDIPFITPADITSKGINYNNRGLSFLGKEKGRVVLKNSLLQVCIGGSIGKVFYTDREVCFNQQINGITLYLSNYKYIYDILSSVYFYENLLENSNGTATPIINKSSWGNLLIPLPPLVEQQRIVERVEKLMSICDMLEEKIVESERVSEKLLESLVKYEVK